MATSTRVRGLGHVPTEAPTGPSICICGDDWPTRAPGSTLLDGLTRSNGVLRCMRTRDTGNQVLAQVPLRAPTKSGCSRHLLCATGWIHKQHYFEGHFSFVLPDSVPDGCLQEIVLRLRPLHRLWHCHLPDRLGCPCVGWHYSSEFAFLCHVCLAQDLLGCERISTSILLVSDIP